MKRFIATKPTVIIADGQKPELSLFLSYAARAKTMIALDGAVSWLIKHGIKPDLVIGDMDSAIASDLRGLKTIALSDQNTNDLAKALTYCRDEGLKEISVFGALGIRSDHMLTNLFVLKQFAPSLTITLIDDHHHAFMCPKNETLLLDNALGSDISLFPLGEKVGPILTTGMQYPLNNEMLSLNSRIGTLNKITASPASIYCEQGHLLVFVSNNACAKGLAEQKFHLPIG